jgi:dinuclear metal center YbgI/SA1388 family protein
MAASLQSLQQLLDTILRPEKFEDYCPNGLQVEGKADVARLITGVTASQALLDAAVDMNADAVMVHHGYFWRGENAQIVGIKRKRIATLIENNISLFAYHLPLDAHPVFGNNARLAELLGIETLGGLFGNIESSVGNIGQLPVPKHVDDFVVGVSSALGRSVQHIAGGPEIIQRIAWCTGAAQGYIEQAADAGVDMYISGEISEPTVHIARERGIHYIAAGHHATERYGVQALGEHVADQLSIDHSFIEIDCPV